MANAGVILILGAGPRVGAAIAKTFAGNGYKVAITSRSGSGTKNTEGVLSLKADFTNAGSIPPLFDAIKKEFGSPPNVVVYNAAALTNPPDKDSVLSTPAESVASDLQVNTISPYVAAQQALLAWETLPQEVKKTFIYTGNVLNTMVIPAPMMMDLGMGKSASAYWIGVADMSYSAKGIRFFYADERQPDGKSKGLALDGPAHAEFFARLAQHEENVPWHATFVGGKGYTKFN